MKRKKLKGIEIVQVDAQQEAVYSGGVVVGVETRIIYWVYTINDKQIEVLAKLGLQFENYNKGLRGFAKAESCQIIKVFCNTSREKEIFWDFILGIKKN